MALSDTSILAFRERNNAQLPKWYDWKLHLLTNLFLLVASALASIELVAEWSLVTLASLISMFVGWGLIEYGLHRFVLHGLEPKLPIKKGHTEYHHGYFTNLYMSGKRSIDVNRIFLLPGHLLMVLALNLVLSALVFVLTSADAALLFFLSGVLYFLVYEVAHALCHLSLPFNLSFLNSIVDHHKVHHNPSTMGTKNFSVVFPFIDSFLYTREYPSSEKRNV